MSKLGAWGTWESGWGREGEERGAEKNVQLNENNLKRESMKE